MAFKFALPLLALSMLVGTPQARQAPNPTAQDLAQSLQKRYATIRDFRADFTHEVRGGVLRTVSTTERGELKVKKPGRLLMTYTSPQKKTFSADGVTVRQYFAADRSGIESPMPTGDQLSSAILFLAGQGDLIKDFKASLPAEQPDNEWALVLTPVTRQEDFETLTLFVDRRTLAFHGMTTVDHQGGTFVFRFTNLRENVGIPDNDFRFMFPRDTNVIHTRGGQH